MGLNPIEAKQVQYLEDRLQEKIDVGDGNNRSGQVYFESQKRQLGVRDIDLFHRIAQAFGVKGVKRIGYNTEFFYEIYFPGDIAHGNWCVHLLGPHSRPEFLKKYQNKYTIY